MKIPQTNDEMLKVIEAWIESVEGHEKLDRDEMRYYSRYVLSILKFIEGDL